MINNYEIKNVNNEEILYIYFNFDYELSSEDFQNKKKQKTNKKIKKFIITRNAPIYAQGEIN